VKPARIDGPCRLSQSVLWRWQRRFYEEQGPAAFTSGVVPWRITSCLLLAAAYADAAIGFARDLPGPIQLLELGGGVGRLAFNLMRALEQRGVPFHYRFTDASRANLEAAAQHPQLRPWIAQGRLSLQQLDALEPTGLTLPPGPVVVVANYLFDSLPHDAWRTEQGIARAQHVEVWAAEPDAPLDRIEWKFVDGATAPPPSVVGYAAALGAGRFLWPTGSIGCVQAIAAQLRRPHLWLVADKGPAALAQLQGEDTASLARHGCVSASVNFDALRAWAGWRPFLAPAVPQMRFGAYAMVQGLPAESVSALRAAWSESAAHNFPLQAEVLLDQLASSEATVSQLLQALAFTHFDPDALLRVSALLRARLSAQTPAPQVAALVAALDETWINRFVLADAHDLAFEIATVLHRAGQLSHAAAYYRRSVELRGPHATTFFNLALCLLDLGNVAEARTALEGTLAEDAAHPRARALLAATG